MVTSPELPFRPACLRCGMKTFAITCATAAAVLGLSSCGAAKWTYQKTKQGLSSAAGAVTGAGSYVAKGAKKLWPFGGSAPQETAAPPPGQSPPNAKKLPADAKPAVAAAPSTPAAGNSSQSPPAAPAPEPSVFQAAKGKRYVSDALLGSDQRDETNSSVPLPDGWRVQGARLHYRSAFIGDPPSLLRAEGRPARVVKDADGKAIVGQGREIHYRQETGILVLKGFPALQVGRKKLAAASAATEILIHLPSGAIHASGEVTTTSE